MVARKIWDLGEKLCRNNFSRRWIFKYLVQSVMAYGMELWGWEEKGELEKNNVRLRGLQVDFQIRCLHPKMCNYEGAG